MFHLGITPIFSITVLITYRTPIYNIDGCETAAPGKSFPSAFASSVVSCRHEGPVWQVAWAHPMYGNILASCSYDRKVIIWKEENGTWEKTYEYTGHDSSGTWGPELGRQSGDMGGCR